MNAQEAERLSIEQKPIAAKEHEERCKQQILDHIANAENGIKDACMRGEEFVDLGYEKIFMAESHLTNNGFLWHTEYNGGGYAKVTISWGNEAISLKKCYDKREQERQEYLNRIPKKKWWQIF